MTQTLGTAEDFNLHTVDGLINVLVALLAPMFMAGAGGDISLARIAALETITSYRVRNHSSLMAVAKIIAFGLTTLGLLGLSMADDGSIPRILHLCGNAKALDRCCERAERALREARALPAAGAPGRGFDESVVRASMAEAALRRPGRCQATQERAAVLSSTANTLFTSAGVERPGMMRGGRG
jgi:hypothetical protein